MSVLTKSPPPGRSRPSLDARQTHLYRLHCLDGTCVLYVGITANLDQRIAYHMATDRKYVGGVTMKLYPDRQSALAVEKREIESLMPPFNGTHNAMREKHAGERIRGSRLNWAQFIARERGGWPCEHIREPV